MTVELRNNDVVFFNLHRRYLNFTPNYGGFLGIFSLAAFLNANGYLAQGFAGGLAEGKELLDEICQGEKTQLVGLYCDYENVTETNFLSRYIKETYGLPVIVGGPQATALDADFLSSSRCDAIVRGEGELTVLELAHYFLDHTGGLEQIQGIMFPHSDGAAVNPDRELIENLDALPAITSDCYLTGKQRPRELSVMTGRGCPFHCAFCHEGSHTKKVRFRSIENVLAEIEAFIDARDGCSEGVFVMFVDDTFTLRPDRVKALCDGVARLQARKKFNWFCEGHIHTLCQHPEMIDYIARAGAQRIQLGIEAGTQEVLDAYRKGSTLEEIEAVVTRCRDAGIQQIFSNIILGGALFTREVYEKNLAYAKKLIELGAGTVEIGVVCYWPLPETEIARHPEAFGLKVMDAEFLTAVGDFPQAETAELTRWEIAEMMRAMEDELDAFMRCLLRENKIPEARVLAWFTRRGSIGATGQWLRSLEREPQIYNFYQLIEKGEAISTAGLNLTDEEYAPLHPLRTIPLYRNAKPLDGGRIEIFGSTLEEFELDLLMYSTGKLSVEEIYGKLRPLHKTKADTPSMAVTALKKLEALHLIVFSKF